MTEKLAMLIAKLLYYPMILAGNIVSLLARFNLVCPCCFRPSLSVRNRRRNAQYVNDRSNWLLSCRVCYDEDCDNYDEMWRDYYASRF